MTFTEAAAEVLRFAGKPLHFKDITQLAIEKNLLSHVGKTPDVTMGARLSLAIKKEPDGVIVRVKPGIFGLREWERSGGRKKRKNDFDSHSSSPQDTSSHDSRTEDANAEEIAALASEVDAAEIHSTQAKKAYATTDEMLESIRRSTRDAEAEEPALLDEDEKMRGQLAAEGNELFQEEDDDDEPLLGHAAAEETPSSNEALRRKRRRRRRGKSRDELPTQDANFSAHFDDDETIGVTIGDEHDEHATRRAIVLERIPPPPPAPSHSNRNRNQEPRAQRHQPPARNVQPTMHTPPQAASALEHLNVVDDFSGRELADIAYMLVDSFDRNQGLVPIRSIAETAARQGKLEADLAIAASMLSAAMHADNLRRSSNGQRPRFRFAPGSRVALTDWSLSPELLRLEQEALLAVERYREATRRTFALKIQKDLPIPGLLELLLLALERIGFHDLRPIRRVGLPSGENHFAGVRVNAGEEIRTAIIFRKDGRDIGRERVIDLRGSLHHYGPATAGWLLTTGQCLSGAREEACIPNTAPIALFDCLGVARLLEENGVAVLKTQININFPNLEFFEMLRSA